MIGAEPSNTAPANCINPDPSIQILRTGVDSLYVSIAGQLRDKSAEMLEMLKLLAQSSDPNDVASAVIELNGHQFEVWDRGRKNYAYVLADNWYQIQVAGPGATSIPLFHTQIGSELLTRGGWEAAVKALEEAVTPLGRSLKGPTISRIDLCVDFSTELDIADIPRDAWVSRCRDDAEYRSHGEFTGYTFGRGGPVLARLYDKTRELTLSNKGYMRDLWAAQGWDGVSTVWRLEFQLRGSVLKELGVGNVSDLHYALAGLWGYVVADWLRLTVPNPSDSTRARWPTHPLWQALSAAPWSSQGPEKLSRVSKSRVPDDDYLFFHGISGLTSYMAREGILDVYDGLDGFIRNAVAYHERLGGDPEANFQRYAQMKVREKARRYNRSLGGPEGEENA